MVNGTILTVRKVLTERSLTSRVALLAFIGRGLKMKNFYCGLWLPVTVGAGCFRDMGKSLEGRERRRPG
jgi:hypothetical protein